jgi:hypothetical protein
VLRTKIETLMKSCRRLGFSRLLNLYEKVEDLAVLGEAVGGNVRSPKAYTDFSGTPDKSELGAILCLSKPREETY